MPSNRSTARLSEPVILRVRRFWPGVVAAVISLSLAVLGTIALVRWDESRTPRTVLGIVCWGGAFSSARTGVRNLCGTLTVDAEGIRLEPRVCGFRLWWSEVSLWCLEGNHDSSRAATFRFWRSGYDTPRSLPAKWFSQNDQVLLVQALRDFASEKARRF